MYDMLGSEKLGWKKGPWSVEEDKLLCEYVSLHGEGRWSSVSKFTGLNRSGKSCRLRWVNYLKPGLKKGQLTPQEQAIIVELHAVLGNKWSTIAKYLAGRTDNEIKNYWRTHHKNKDRSSSSRRNKRQDYHKRRPKKLQLQPPPQQYHDDDNNVNNNNINHHEPNFPDITNFTTIEDDQYYNNDYLANYFMNNQEQYWGSAALEDEGLWISLWNLEDTEGHARCGTMHNQHTTNSNATSSFHDIYHHVR